MFFATASAFQLPYCTSCVVEASCMRAASSPICKPSTWLLLPSKRGVPVSRSKKLTKVRSKDIG